MDFRPDYKEIPILQSLFEVPNIALTATATITIQKDIYNVLGFQTSKTEVVAVLPDRYFKFSYIYNLNRSYLFLYIQSKSYVVYILFRYT